VQPLRLHSLTLAFTGEWALLEGQFRADDFRTALPRIRVSTVMLVVIFALFALLDHYIDPESARGFLLIRFGLITPAALAFLLLSWTKWFEKVYQPLAAFTMTLGAFGVMYMMAFGNQAVRSSHQTGLLLVIVSLFVFLGLRFIWALAGWIPIFAGFILVNHFHSASPEVLRAVSTFLFLSISVVCFEVCRRLELSRRRNFALQWSLSLEKAMVAASNTNLEKRIDERTRELLHANQVLRDEMNRTERLFQEKNLLQARLYHSEKTGSEVPEAVVAADSGGTETILLVEADETVRSIAGKTLASLGYQVLSASGEQQALDLSTRFEGNIDLLLVDVVMPLPGGQALAGRLMGERPGMKVLFTSGYSADMVPKQGVLSQGARFIDRPRSTAELAKRMREVLEEG